MHRSLVFSNSFTVCLVKMFLRMSGSVHVMSAHKKEKSVSAWNHVITTTLQRQLSFKGVHKLTMEWILENEDTCITHTLY